MEHAPPVPVEPEPGRVTMLEVFFDLVYVFTLTQLTLVLAEGTWQAAGRAAIMLVSLYWMYGGYAWLTNSVRLDGPRGRLLLLGGMAGFLVIALAVPRAFDGDALAFGLGYLAVVVIHGGTFLHTSPDSAAAAFRGGVAPFNLLAAALLIAGGLAGGTLQYWLWGGACIATWGVSLLVPQDGFVIEPVHFVERYGLVLIVTLGEAVLVTGQTLAADPVSWATAAIGVLGLSLAALLWTAYFAGEGANLEHAFASMPVQARPRAVLDGFGLASMPALGGILAIAAAQKHALDHLGSGVATADAVLLAAGTAAFLLGVVLLHVRMSLPVAPIRLVLPVLVLATIPIGREITGIAQLASIVAIVGCGLSIESRLRGRSAGARSG